MFAEIHIEKIMELLSLSHMKPGFHIWKYGLEFCFTIPTPNLIFEGLWLKPQFHKN